MPQFRCLHENILKEQKSWPKMEVVKSSKGSPMILYEGHQYLVHKALESGNIRWRCRETQKRKCKGSLITDRNHELLKGPTEHQHEASDAKNHEQNRRDPVGITLQIRKTLNLFA